jgi:predicted metal-dependent hydrolase
MARSRRCYYGSYYCDYFLVYEDRKSFKLTVKPSLEIVATAPLKVSIEDVEHFMHRKWLWMNKQLQYFGKFQKKIYEKEYISGESFLYLGRQYQLIVKKGKEDLVSLQRGRLLVTTTKSVQNGKYNKELIEKWYLLRTQIVLHDRFQAVFALFQYKDLPTLRIQKMTKRWGSYVNNKKIILNPALIHASKDCIDYVIAHEFCHFRYKNHTKKFYTLLESKVPEWEKIKEKLELRYS